MKFSTFKQLNARGMEMCQGFLENIMTNQDEIYLRVKGLLVEALNIQEEEVVPDATLSGDLGAESIDFLDIIFRLELEFEIKIPRGELFPESIFQGDPEFVENDKVTAKGIDLLKKYLPYADVEAFAKNPGVDNLRYLYTVKMIVKYVQHKLAP